MPNVIVISGRLGSDFDSSKQLANGGEANARANFSIAFNEGTGANRSSAWVDVTVFGKHADTVAGYGLRKGQEVVVTGRLTKRGTGMQEGSNGKSYERPIFGVIANFVEPGRMAGEGRSEGGNGGGTPVAKDDIPDF